MLSSTEHLLGEIIDGSFSPLCLAGGRKFSAFLYAKKEIEQNIALNSVLVSYRSYKKTTRNLSDLKQHKIIILELWK